MSTASHKDYCLSKYKDKQVDFLINRKLLIHKQLEKSPRTYVVYSDLHGSYDKYLHWLKNGLGYYQIAVADILGAHYSSTIYESYERLLLLVNRTRLELIEGHIESGKDEFYAQGFFEERVPKKFIDCLDNLEEKGISKKRILEDLLKLLRRITRGDEHRIIKVVPPALLENILKLYYKDNRASYWSLVDGIVSNTRVFQITASLIVKLTLINMFDKHINLGDTFDRGNDADKLVQLYKILFGPSNNSSPLHYLWGNHDILWLGAAIGNPILCMTALRISMRYNNTDFLDRYGFSLEKLKNFAKKCYKIAPTGKYLKGLDIKTPEGDLASKMSKVLQILESKLTVSYLRDTLSLPGDIDYREQYEYHSELLKLIPTDIKEDRKEWDRYMSKNPLYTDVYFPTVSKENPEALTAEEEEIVNDLVSQFTGLPKLQDHMKWLFEKGETYRVVDNTIYYHAAIPATEEMDLAEIKGMKGKSLLDFIQRDLKRIGQHHRDDKALKLREKMLLWYLWCGDQSPFFCKSKMATLERAIFNKEVAAENPITTWTEHANPYYKHIRNDLFLNKILVEFHADHICMGHTPVKSNEQGILSSTLGAYIVDGGASDAYGDRGVVLINTPEYTYMTQHPPLEELKQAEREERLPNIEVTPLEEKKNIKLRHTDKGYFLRRELEAIDGLLSEKLDEFYDKYFY